MKSQNFVFDDGFVEAVNSFAVNNQRRVFIVSGLEANGIVRLKKDSFESGLMRVGEADEAVVAAADFGGGRKDNDVAFPEFRLHRISDDSYREGIGVVQVWAADIIVGDAGRIAEVVKIGGITGGNFVDNRYEFSRGDGRGVVSRCEAVFFEQ